MRELFRKIFGKEHDNIGSKDIAKDRLRMVLVHDRKEASPQVSEYRGVDMLDLFHKIFGKEQESGSKDIAKERLRMVLVHDRANASPQFMQNLKDDMIQAISHYMDINEKDMEINLSQDKDSVALVANIPVNRMKRVIAEQPGQRDDSDSGCDA